MVEKKKTERDVFCPMCGENAVVLFKFLNDVKPLKSDWIREYCGHCKKCDWTGIIVVNNRIV